ncbi:DUF2066 domain-containing protein [Thioalkalivibrio sp. ALJ16]|uniref:DUF2066 domain-containing protein n=1 Tax=Thioalkalivibrio sp. ALJ16 TaxID=1158762 RepID=UPI000476D6F9|nr:DUF2066 domain-containing protein [Thioalkalivibrio sp. ALJ16]
MSLHLRTRYPVAVLLGLVLLLLAPLAAAQDSLVATVAAEDEAGALEQGLEQALVRLAGLRSEPVLALVEEMLETRDDDGWIAALERLREVEEGVYRLEFDPFRLRTALRDAGVPAVLGERPGLLVWAVLDRNGQRELLGDAVEGRGVLSALESLAAERDMPLLFPLGDLQDRRAAQPSDIVGGVTEPLLEAARRYQADGVILLHVRETATGAEARSVAVHDGREFRGSAPGADAGTAARAAVAQGLDQVAERLARVAAEPEWVRLGFVDVQGYAAFERLRAELVRLQAVEAARLDSLMADRVVLQVRTGLEPGDLVDLLRGSGFDRSEPPDDADAADVWLDRG